MTRQEITKETQKQVNYCTPLYPESFIQGYIASAEPREKRIAELESKIADIKANCDLAIEGRDVKIKELERLNSNQAESLRITMLEEEKKGKRIEELEQQIEKMKKYAKLLQDICTVMGNEPYMVWRGLEQRVRLLWDKSEEGEGLQMADDILDRLLKISAVEWAEINKWEIKEND